eukprot:Platyproteum_vivax@DN2207_c0_g1_i1.p1
MSEEQIKAAKKSGNKKGADLQGLHEMGGMKYFVCSIDGAEGEVEAVKAAITESHNEAPLIGKLFLSASDTTKVALVCFVPEEKQAEVSAIDWLHEASKGLEGKFLEESKGYSVYYAEANPDKGLYAIKMKDQAINQGLGFLKAKGLFPDDDDSDDDIVYGDDEIGSF